MIEYKYNKPLHERDFKMTVTYKDYLKELAEFAAKHNANGELKVYTSPMVNNRYHKDYCWSHGANFSEITELVTEEVEVEVHGLKVKVNVEFWKTEYWSTEAGSKYFYQKA